ncbi:MAG: hypothetical protein MJZ21_01860 [archaeon]|nr:hypothetical protein [archaeon]
MRSSDAHLERALEEYNDKVNRLEDEGNTKELLDAYINRGMILSMMECNVSAIDDFNEAISIITDLENSGHSVDPGYFVKCYISRGELQSVDGGDSMADDYCIAASRLKELQPTSKYYDERKIIDMCSNCAGDMIDSEHPVEALDFINKGMSLLVGRTEDDYRNCYVEFSNLLGQYYMDTTEAQKAYDTFKESIRVAKELYESGKLDEMMDLVLAYVSKGDMDEVLELESEFFADREAAIELMEDMKICGTLDDDELLSSLHGEIAQAYMQKGKIKEAEKHLMKQVSYNLSGSTEYLNGDYDDE